MKRIFTILMAVVMTVSLLTIGVLAAETPETNPVEHIHVFDKKTMLTPPTCKTEGAVIAYCSGEGECELPGGVWTEPLSKVDCAPLEDRLGVREVSCTRDGYTGDVCCKWCLSVLEKGEVVPKTGHTPGSWVVDAWRSDETTTIRYRFCTVCSQIAESEEIPTTPELIPEEPTVHEHAFDESVIEIEPTCQTEGLAVTRCTADGYCDLISRAKSEVLPKAECSPIEERIGQADATCVSEGRTGDLICKWCMTVMEESEVIPKLDHTPADKRIGAFDATCISEGRTGVLLCKNCLSVIEESKVISKLDHTPADKRIGAIDATCITEGRTGKLLCKDCLSVIEESKVISKLDHTPADKRIGAIDATCVTQRRTGELLCKDCKTLLEDSKSIAKTEHKPGDWITDELQSNDDVTVRHRFCKVCLQIVETKETPVVHPDSPFADVSYDDYYFDSVLWAVDHKVTAGTSATTFSPEKVITRAEVVTMLWRANGSPVPQFDWNPFTDVSTDAYYYNAVLWAVENDVTAGTTETTFSPDTLCTRAQVMTMLWRAKGSPLAEHAEDVFLDVAKDDYFYVPVLWAMENGITGGTGLFLFSPHAPCSRAQIVTFLYKAK